MGMTFFSVGDKIMVPATITEIHVCEKRIEYYAKLDNVIFIHPTNNGVSFYESDRERILLKHEKETSDGQD